MADERKALRQSLRDQRRAISAKERIAGAEGLARQLRKLSFAPSHGHVAGYWAMDGEIALHAWQLGLPDTVTYCLPVLSEDGRLRFAPWAPGMPLASNRFGIPEPTVTAEGLLNADQMQFVVLPLVGFDDRLQRLGMGGGWYDRSFAFRADARAPPPWLVGAGFAAQQVKERLLAQPWDVRLDAVCTDRSSFLDMRPRDPA